MDPIIKEFLQYGALGAVALLAIAGLVWSMRQSVLTQLQFVTFLKDQVSQAAEEREREREERRLWRAIITETQATMRDQVAALRDHTERGNIALRDVTETLHTLARRS